MYCDRCGTPLEENANFCRVCGHAVAGAAVQPRAAPVARHVRILGILWIVISALRLVPALALFTLVAHVQMQMHVPPFVRALFPVIGLVILLVAVAGFIAAWGLLDRQPWARTLAIVLGIIGLVDLPLGTALGVYTLWVLLPNRPGLPGGEPGGGPMVPSRT